MQARNLTRRFVLLLPFAVAACAGGDEDVVFEPLRYTDLPPIQVNVASIVTEQRFIPAGVAPDVSYLDPAPPIEALKAMANDRLKAFGTSRKAVFAVLDASLTRDEDDVVTGSFAVSLTILDDNGTQLGYARAQVQNRHTGRIRDIRPVLYDMTKAMMNDMNVEFEYQIRHNLKAWLTDAAAPDTAVQQTPLAGSAPAEPLPAANPQYSPNYLQPPADGSGLSGAVPPASPAYPPTYLQPPANGPAMSVPPPPMTPAYPPSYLQPPAPR